MRNIINLINNAVAVAGNYVAHFNNNSNKKPISVYKILSMEVRLMQTFCLTRVLKLSMQNRDRDRERVGENSGTSKNE